MDELYGNAWGDSSDLAGDNQPSKPTWVTPKLATHDEEADLAAPSWSTGESIQWNEPSEEAHGFNWTSNDPDLAWTADSVYHDIQIRSSPSQEPDDDESEPSAATDIDEESREESSSTTLPVIDDRGLTSPALELPQLSSPISRSSSPDGFGTFESGIETTKSPVITSLSRDVEEDAWSSPWVGTEETEGEETYDKVDEWETARREKEKLDQKLPPEVLANMVAQCAEYFEDPNATESASSASDSSKSTAEPWMNQWRDGLDSIEGLDVLVQAIVPNLVLEPAPVFSKTVIARNLATGIRLTKNLSLAKNSPFSHYLAAKGLTAWEASVKERKVVIEEDVVPAGWRILEKQPAVDAVDTAKASKQGGGIFSFWGRRHTKTASVNSDSSDQSSPSLVRSSSVPPAETASLSRRVSQDSAQTPPADDHKHLHSTPEPVHATPQIQEVPSPLVDSRPPSSYADAPDPHVDSAHTPPPQQLPPSAVSRFLTRFSRKRSSLSPSSSRTSFALSLDDLDVLSDIVPSAQDGFEDGGTEPSAPSLSNILKAEPLPPALPPPPTAQKTARQKQALDLNVDPATGGVSSHKSLPSDPVKEDDMDSFFGAFEGSSKPASAESGPIAAVPLDPIRPPSVGSSRSQSPASAGLPPLQPTNSSRLSLGDYSMPTNKPLSQPSLLSPVPRPETPSASPLHSIVPEPSLFDSSSSVGNRRLQPKIPLPMHVPPLPSVLPIPPPLSSTSSSSSRSEVPLAQLYPNAALNNRMAPSKTSVARTPSPFILDPPARTRNATPIMISGPAKPSAPPPLLPPPPSFGSQPNSVPQTRNLFDDDDDDFADFQTSSLQTPSTAQIGVTPQRNVSAVAPAVSASGAAKQPPSFLTNIPTAPQPSSSDPFNDDFSTFFSTPSSNNHKTYNSGNSGLNTSFAPTSDKSLFTGQNGHSDFDDFLSSPSSSALRTPSPPRPPTKVSKPHTTLPRIAVDAIPQLSNEEKQNRHQRTLSLMEMAAARPGQWPAPPSPLPQALSFPAPGGLSKALDFMADDDSFGTFQTDTIAPSASGSSLLPPVAGTQILAKPAPFFGGSPAISPPSASLKSYTASQPSNTGGGLSAQDLSFFEGL